MQVLKKKMVDIMEDGEVTEDEVQVFRQIISSLSKLAEVISELKLSGEKVLKGR